jgi:transposase-like protein
MTEKHIVGNESKRIFYGELEEYARGKIREHLQDLLEQEVSEWLGREKSERKQSSLEQPGYRNGYGKPRRFTMSLGTMEVRRPRVRDLGERFVSKILPLFKRQSKEVRGLIPELYLHGLASGDFELALRELLGEGRRYRPRRYSGSRRSGRENMSSGRARGLRRRSGRIVGLTGFM